jgi:hypothetical protein
MSVLPGSRLEHLRFSASTACSGSAAAGWWDQRTSAPQGLSGVRKIPWKIHLG